MISVCILKIVFLSFALNMGVTLAIFNCCRYVPVWIIWLIRNGFGLNNSALAFFKIWFEILSVPRLFSFFNLLII